MPDMNKNPSVLSRIFHMEMETKLMLLVGIFAMSLTSSAVLGSKIVPLFGSLTFSATAIVFPLTFLITDVVGEVWGKRKAHQVVWIGFATALLTSAIVWIAVSLPVAGFWNGQDAYAQTFGLVPRIVFGGLIAYLVSQHLDIWVFHFVRNKTEGKHLWIRNNVSTVMSQLLNTVLFVGIAFIGVLPNGAILPTMAGHFLIKAIIAVADTPFVYLAVAWAKESTSTTVAESSSSTP